MLKVKPGARMKSGKRLLKVTCPFEAAYPFKAATCQAAYQVTYQVAAYQASAITFEVTACLLAYSFKNHPY